MSVSSAQQLWQVYRQQELDGATFILQKLGFELTKDQPHIGGERYLSSTKKLVLLGHRISDHKKVVIKISSDEQGSQEIVRERNCRQTLAKIDFAYHVFLSPAEILFKQISGYTIFITAFIEQERSFLQRPLLEQFFLALKALELQEGAQVATYGHAKLIGQTFGLWTAKNYLQKLTEYQRQVKIFLPEDQALQTLISQAYKFFSQQTAVIDLYTGWLTHWDFVPHNFRIKDDEIYLLDHSSLRFGNKYESWARFINFMTLYNAELEKLLINYVKENRQPAEFLSLQLMRVFRLTELIWHYAKTLSQVSGNLQILNKTRINFWGQALQAVLAHKILDPEVIGEYKKTRDSLRDEAEKKRQAELH